MGEAGGRKGALQVGLIGLGTVGGGVADALIAKKDDIACLVGCPIALKKVLVRDPAKPRSPKLAPQMITTNPEDILGDPEIDIVVEVMGGEQPALEYMQQAISRGKAIVTANKEVIAKHGPELFALALKHKTDIYYEASVGGGIPLIAPFKQDLLANKISSIYAIINGTTNYILTKMAQEGLDFAAALSEAQALGYAEPDPSNDVEGVDAAYKLAILATLAFRTQVRPADVHHEGITRLAARDFRYARELGYAIKLLAIGKEEDGSVELRVHPTFLPEELLLAKVDGVFNAVQVEGDLIGRALFYGRGAGSLPTSSAVVADVIDLARNMTLGVSNRLRLDLKAPAKLRPMAEISTRYYVRMNVADRPGVLAQIARTLGDHQISIASVIQKEVDESAQAAEIVIMTHLAKESAMQQALQELAGLNVVREIGNFVRVEN